MSNHYLNYAVYILGYFAIFYIAILILRHVLLYYIVKTLLRFVKFIDAKAKDDLKNEKKDQPQTDREDELKRDQELEIFKQQASEIKKSIARKKESGDTLDVDVERLGGDTSQGAGNMFEESASRVGIAAGMVREKERVVGVVDQNSLPKWQKLVFQKMFKDLNQIANIMVQYQVQSPEKYGYWTSYVTARGQQSKAERGDQMNR